MGKKIITKFFEYLNHQTPDSNNVNSPGFGQGAHHGNWGADYGNPSQGVRGTFGRKGDNEVPKPTFPTVTFNPFTNEFLAHDEVFDLINQYNIRCDQLGDEKIDTSNVDSDLVGYMSKYLHENK